MEAETKKSVLTGGVRIYLKTPQKERIVKVVNAYNFKNETNLAEYEVNDIAFDKGLTLLEKELNIK